MFASSSAYTPHDVARGKYTCANTIEKRVRQKPHAYGLYLLVTYLAALYFSATLFQSTTFQKALM